MTLEDDPSGQKVSCMLLEKSRGQLQIAPERMEQLGQSRNDTQLWMCLMVKVKSDAEKNNVARKPGMLVSGTELDIRNSQRCETPPLRSRSPYGLNCCGKFQDQKEP